MKHSLEPKILAILNNWCNNLTPTENSELISLQLSKHKFRTLFLKKTGEFLKMSQQLETQLFSKIVYGLSKNHAVDEDLVDQYLSWCFENYDFFIKKYKAFNLNNIANFADMWTPDLFSAQFMSKQSYKDLLKINVSDNVFHHFEIFGIPWVATKLAKEKQISSEFCKKLILEKLSGLTNDTQSFSKLKNMLRKTVENGPYSSEYIFSDYTKELKQLFLNFINEPWCKNVV